MLGSSCLLSLASPKMSGKKGRRRATQAISRHRGFDSLLTRMQKYYMKRKVSPEFQEKGQGWENSSVLY